MQEERLRQLRESLSKKNDDNQIRNTLQGVKPIQTIRQPQSRQIIGQQNEQPW